ncbi:YhjD/YihY/BrkB family envelope integrity protein [Calidithermus roseus]|uniref:YihY family inner membrane protein n=1 Tax=Calidithermus roseus TaxID=1644118 RepID=A0A399EGU2_9DEIN|nr:YhjD/YihY/BrkB family envelope integrity protein [Calidithermus roseus]RIH83168.1 YihY family inner membrane protein [Calidithermus roseus]
MNPWLSRMYRAYTDAHIPFFAAALAYYALFSLMPLLFLLVGVFGFVLSGNEDLRNAFLLRLVELTVYLLPTEPELAGGLVSFLTRGAFSITLGSLVILLWTSSNFFAALAHALSIIFGGLASNSHQNKPPVLAEGHTSIMAQRLLRLGQRSWRYVRSRVLALLAPLMLGLALILLALGGLVLSFVLRYLPPELGILRGGLEVALPLIGAFVLFLLTYVLLPLPAPRLGAAVVAASVAALAWDGMRLGLPLLLPRAQYYEVLYGPIAGFLLALVGFYLTMWILLVGAVLARGLSE